MEKLTIEEMKEIARSRGGKCLSIEYIDNNTKLKWRCKEDHIWEAKPNNIKSGTWCPKCGIKSRADKQRGNIEDMQKIAEARGGICLSKEYKDAKTKLKWQCREGHSWEAIPDQVKRGSWCPHCSIYRSEKICRGWFEAIFGKKFPKRKPFWLLNIKTGYKMELDGYSKKLEIAFEYQGIQHFENRFGVSNIEDVRQKDKWKKNLCKIKGVKLIEIPYNISHKNIGKYILKKCKEKGIETNINLSLIDFKKYDVYSDKQLEEMKEIAEKREGKCLSNVYVNNNTKLKWMCNKGHVWEATPHNIKSGGWCPYCAGKYQIIADMQKLVVYRGGKCLSEEYVNNKTKLKWKCKEGHTWEATPNNIKSGKWCPYCAGNVRLTIEEMKEIAMSRGGKCLSEEYVNSLTKLKWQCREGHTWEATPNNIKSGTWCSYCARKHHIIEEMQNLVEAIPSITLR